MRRKAIFICGLILLLISLVPVLADVKLKTEEKGSLKIFSMQNSKIECYVILKQGKIDNQRFSVNSKWAADSGRNPVSITSSGDFNIDIMWTGWSGPGMINNGENPVLLTKKDFVLHSFEKRDKETGEKEFVLLFRGTGNPFLLKIVYSLKPGDFFVRRSVAVRDTVFGYHFLRWMWPENGTIKGDIKVIKSGGFGQPLAFLKGNGGGFIGLEYPTAENHLKKGCSGVFVKCGQEFGRKITDKWVSSETVVWGLTPDKYVRNWFMKYLDDVRVAPLRPYLLYNSWYDVRSKIYTKRPEDVMNEKNVMRIIKDFEREMVKKRGLKLDAFVLDDGWDVYESDWQLRKEEFPNGLKPLSDELAKNGTALGIWFGPTGGYSYRRKRINWMKAHGYETVGEDGNAWHREMMCLAGRNYKALFKKRVTDFVKNDGIGYFKWDGIQFSCNEPDHGHAVGIYSRRAVMESVAEMCRAVRSLRSDMFLNITSGTWLSPWWLKYANMIWMQGGDYGFANVPSISKRDAAITYRDLVLFEDFGLNKFWFPVSNLMTHGIIKGHLQKLGGEAEPIDKFTDNAVLYFARGVTMWELYISPNLLTDAEWSAIGKSIKWAKDRFPILQNTVMFGGNPNKREPYGYAHFKGNRGIIAVRNPDVFTKSIDVTLSRETGLEKNAADLVVEQVYPFRKILPVLYSSGKTLTMSLDGYETAVYEVYPVSCAKRPLLAGVIFEDVLKDDGTYVIKILETGDQIRLLNPEFVPDNTEYKTESRPSPLIVRSAEIKGDRKNITVDFNLNDSAINAELALLFEYEGATRKDEYRITVTKNGQAVEPEQRKQGGMYQWVKISVSPGTNKVCYTLQEKGNLKNSRVSAWIITNIKPEVQEVEFSPLKKVVLTPMPPKSIASGLIKKTVCVGNISIK